MASKNRWRVDLRKVEIDALITLIEWNQEDGEVRDDWKEKEWFERLEAAKEKLQDAKKIPPLEV